MKFERKKEFRKLVYIKKTTKNKKITLFDRKLFVYI